MRLLKKLPTQVYIKTQYSVTYYKKRLRVYWCPYSFYGCQITHISPIIFSYEA